MWHANIYYYIHNPCLEDILNIMCTSQLTDYKTRINTKCPGKMFQTYTSMQFSSFFLWPQNSVYQFLLSYKSQFNIL
jgi:hypothetical protein